MRSVVGVDPLARANGAVPRNRVSGAVPEGAAGGERFFRHDGVRKSLGEESYTIRFTPRKPSSHWSAVNLKRVKELIAEQRMKPSGLRAYERCAEGKAGQYSYEQRHSIELNTEGLKVLRADKAAWNYFEAQAPPYRAAAKHWVMSAKKEETREKRLGILIESCAAGRPIPPMRWAKK